MGIITTFAGFLLVAASSFSGGGAVSSGGVVFIGPFPIVFGSGPDSGSLIALSILIAVVMVAFSFLSFWMARSRRGEAPQAE